AANPPAYDSRVGAQARWFVLALPPLLPGFRPEGGLAWELEALEVGVGEAVAARSRKASPGPAVRKPAKLWFAAPVAASVRGGDHQRVSNDSRRGTVWLLPPTHCGICLCSGR